jgi:hypothetical protein
MPSHEQLQCRPQDRRSRHGSRYVTSIHCVLCYLSTVFFFSPKKIANTNRNRVFRGRWNPQHALSSQTTAIPPSFAGPDPPADVSLHHPATTSASSKNRKCPPWWERRQRQRGPRNLSTISILLSSLPHAVLSCSATSA